MSDKVKRDPIHKAGFDHPCRETCSGWQQGFDRGYDDGMLKGSEVGDATANRFKVERDADMTRLQAERIEWLKELNHYRDGVKKLLAMSDTFVTLEHVKQKATEILSGYPK